MDADEQARLERMDQQHLLALTTRGRIASPACEHRPNLRARPGFDSDCPRHQFLTGQSPAQPRTGLVRQPDEIAVARGLSVAVRRPLHDLSFDKLVQNTRDKRLIRDAFCQGPLLERT